MNKVNVLLVGSGGREHALAWKILQSPILDELYVAPGNAGTQECNIPIGASEIEKLSKFAKEKGCFTIVGPENPLALGLVDRLSREGLPAFGPTGAQAQLESSKAFAKMVMKQNLTPTAEYKVFDNPQSAVEYCEVLNGNCVIKVDGLASGKGVFLCSKLEEAKRILDEIFLQKRFGASGERVVIEEKLKGPEISFIAICDGKDAIPFGTAKDYKRLLDGDRGPNTGGMGAISPAPNFDGELETLVLEKIIHPCERQTGFKGFLYAGLILTQEGPKVLEFNSRLGDPETQAMLPGLESDLLQHLTDLTETNSVECIRDKVLWDQNHRCCVVMCSEGYPVIPKLGIPIMGMDWAKKTAGVLIFHAGTTEQNGALVTSGGRVVCVTGSGSSLNQARASAYQAVKLISWPGENHRTDIGRVVGS
jgi:phosphoribosylamine--glycine ligase